MIQSFADDITEDLFHRRPIKKIPAELARLAAKRLLYLHAATRIEDLYQPPSNNFHKVGSGFAIRVNTQWRITFKWTESGPAKVRFVDYH